ncbi:MAG: FtsX-like permease family protein, partial [Bdellovibrionales bacterium]|nr:FtsX-like permease family protein [Bdellovibrionales bacterium]
FYYLTQLGFLGALSAFGALVLSFLIVPLLQSITKTLIPMELSYQLSYQTVMISVIIGVIGSFCICLPFLAKLSGVSPSVLLKGGALEKPLMVKELVLFWSPGFLLFWLLSLWQANSYIVGSLFVASFFISIGVLFFISIIVLKLIQSIQWSSKNLSFYWALRDLSRDQVTSISSFLALGLGAVLLNLIPQVEASLSHELESPESSRLPSLFMFDIQDEQLETLQSLLSQQNLKMAQVSPMIQSRLLEVNGSPFDKGEGADQGLTREEERETRFRNRGFNLSYRDQLSDSESIYDGKPIEDIYQVGSSELPKISLEKRFADRLNLKIGDILKFDIEGVEVKGQIYNLRTVKWTSFQPNFFVQFQPGVLEAAPKSFIATVSHLSEDQKLNLQREIVKVTPNVSIIDVSKLVKKLSEIIRQMSLALQGMAIMCLISGFVVIFSIVSHQMEKQKWQLGLEKVLGASFSTIRGQILYQYLLLAAAAATLGVLISIVFSYLLSRLLFESEWIFDPYPALISLTFILLTTAVITLLASYRYLKEEPKYLLS